ncbi:MAG TPA: AraC family ligand binding domain-containing protein, partial [Candidatus Methylacidiphilales bacterium]
MQKRSRKPISRVFHRILLPAAFPLKIDSYRQDDARITYLHYHECLEVGYCHKGSGIFMVEEKVFRFNAGDVCVINQDETHLAQSARGTASEWHFLYFDPVALAMPMPAGGGAPSFDGRTLAGRKFANILAAAEHPEVCRLVREIIEEGTGRR